MGAWWFEDENTIRRDLQDIFERLIGIKCQAFFRGTRTLSCGQKRFIWEFPRIHLNRLLLREIQNVKMDLEAMNFPVSVSSIFFLF